MGMDAKAHAAAPALRGDADAALRRNIAQFRQIVGGAVLTETVFAWPGLGRLLIDSVSYRDYPVIQGCLLFVGVVYVIVNLLIDLQRDMGISFLFISHDMAVVERVSHRVAVMYLGQIVEIGPRRAIFENPQHPYTKKLMSAVPIADPARRHLKRALLSDEIPSPIRKLGDEPVVQPLVQVGTDHFVARHAVGGAY